MIKSEFICFIGYNSTIEDSPILTYFLVLMWQTGEPKP